MEISQFEFQLKKNKIVVFLPGSNPNVDALDRTTSERRAGVHPDLRKACQRIVPELVSYVSLSKGDYKLKKITFNVKQEKESIVTIVVKTLKNGQELKLHLPAVEVKDKLVPMIAHLKEEIEFYATGEKQDEGLFSEPGEETKAAA